MSSQAKINPTLKDLDFTESGEKITIGEDSKEVLMKALHSDVQVCRETWTNCHSALEWASLDTLTCRIEYSLPISEVSWT